MSLQDCLDLFTNEEILDGDEKPVSSVRMVMTLIFL